MSAPGAGSLELRLRILSSLVLGAAALASAWFGGWPLCIVWLVAALAIACEWMAMARIANVRAVTVVACAALVLVQILTVAAIAWRPAPSLAVAGLACAIVLLLGVALALCGSLRDRAWALAGIAYAAPVAVVPVLLRLERSEGAWPLLWIFAVVWTTDVAAYFVGRAVGGPKLLPRVSPKKTWSGFLGGLAGAVLAGTALAAFADARAGWDLADVATIVILSAIASVASQAGDLAESAMKRHFGVKDSGRLIPGHGGFMDRLDGFAAVAILVCILVPLGKLSLWTVAP